MKQIFILLISFFLVFSSFSANSQRVDSLIHLTQFSKDHIQILEAYLAWDEEVYASFPDSSIFLNSKVVQLSEEYLKSTKDSVQLLAIKTQMASALNNLGSTFNQQGKYHEALKYHFRSLAIKKEIGNQQGMATSLNNIGYVYLNQVNTAKSLEYFHQSLKIREEIGDKRGVAGSLINLGTMYYHQQDQEKALEYYFRCVEILKEIDDQRRMAYAYINIGHIFSDQRKTEEAREYFNKSLEICEKMNYPLGLADVLNNLGAIHLQQMEITEALNSFDKALEIYRQVDSKKGIASTINNKAKTYLSAKDYSKAIRLANEAMVIAKETDLNLEIKNASQTLYLCYEKLGNNQKAYDMFRLYISVRDTILSEENQKQAIRQEIKYSYDKQAAADSIQAAEAQKVMNAQIAAQKAQISQEKTQRLALYGGLFMLVLFGGFMYNRFRVTRQQKVLIELQKEEVEEKNKEILDSINYAKRIQTAILPAPHLVNDYLKESFILYKPKDIVAGDFYWMEKKEDLVLFAAADCTGHGVPGAMVSVVCHNGLNRAVREYALNEPGEILDKTREIVVQEFEKSDEEVQDGMDIALCSLQGMKLEYAGANNPLWILRNGEILETKANKQPIGKYDLPKPYTTHQLNLQKGDTIYIFSDGYADQFGGEKGKKLKAKAFKELLLQVQHLSMQEQKDFLNQAFEDWKGDLDQIDDICVIGVKV